MNTETMTDEPLPEDNNALATRLYADGGYYTSYDGAPLCAITKNRSALLVLVSCKMKGKYNGR